MQTWRLDSPRQSLVLAFDGQGAPFVLHYGARLPDDENLSQLEAANRPQAGGSMPDKLAPISVCPEPARAFTGHPGLILRDEAGQLLRLSFKDLNVNHTAGQWTASMQDQGVTLTWAITLHADTETVVLQTYLSSQNPVFVDWLAAPVIPVPAWLDHMSTLSGRWRDEFKINEHPWQMGITLRENRTGRTDHAHFPGLLVHEQGTSNTRGDIYGLHYGWSGGHRMVAEQLQDGRRQIQFGHMPDDDRQAVHKAETAPLFVTWGDGGKNEVARAFQRHVRAHILPVLSKTKPRPVHYNCWEAIYFDHKTDDLKAIADHAAELGAERFVLDDGWFGKRDDDTSSLGDWVIDARKYPDGLTPLIDYVNRLGMGFGIWFEPEMINPDSDLYRQHPDWILGAPDQVTGRYQMVLNMARKDVRDYLFDRMSTILANHAIEYVKWDHNRLLPVIDQGQAVGFYDLLDRLRLAHPEVEFESCASGGGRIDFGVLGRTDRVWLSDSNDALERIRIQHDAALFIPFEVTGSHIGPRHCHTTGRVFSAAFRAWVAAQRHMGFEADPRELTVEEKDDVKSVIVWWKDNRDWMCQADILRLNSPDPAMTGEIQLLPDQSRFVAFIAFTDTMQSSLPLAIRLTGLDPNKHYEVKARSSQATPNWTTQSVPWQTDTITLSGQALMQTGLHLPQTFPATLWILEGQLAS